jgi:hypothetical protein
MAKSVYQQIASVDEQIDGLHREMERLGGGVRPRSAGGWQKLLDRFPVMAESVRDLYRQRGELQLIRDNEEYKAAQRTKRAVARKFQKSTPKKCASCGALSYEA